MSDNLVNLIKIKKYSKALIGIFFSIIFFPVCLFFISFVNLTYSLNSNWFYNKQIFSLFISGQTFVFALYIILFIIVIFWYIFLNVLTILNILRLSNDLKLKNTLLVFSILSIIFLFILGNIIIIILVNMELSNIKNSKKLENIIN